VGFGHRLSSSFSDTRALTDLDLFSAGNWKALAQLLPGAFSPSPFSHACSFLFPPFFFKSLFVSPVLMSELSLKSSGASDPVPIAAPGIPTPSFADAVVIWFLPSRSIQKVER